jgi:hypothetical protein
MEEGVNIQCQPSALIFSGVSVIGPPATPAATADQTTWSADATNITADQQ